MTATELKARLQAAAVRLTTDMDDPDVAHRLKLLLPGIEQLETTIAGLESKVTAVAEHRAGGKPPPQVVAAEARGRRRKDQHASS